ncbi:glycosyltransferase family 2 protein [Synechococcus sp. CCY 9618]|uniref:glycosyltransferase n=1 Tax=Synechococcus sp. CCY 9618 TaxID=2815602 RepID=UPI001C227B7C|nr:glycosyltransferase family 2 protein [Synechococcus sp. CCY 9618]
MAAGGSDSDRRRAKAALFLACCGLAGIAPHWLPPGRSLVPALSLATLLGGYSLRTVLLQAFRRRRPGLSPVAPPPVGPSPAVDVVVAARDEQAVIARLVDRIAGLRWPEGQLTLWVVDDGSDDRTPELLAELQGRHPFLRVLRRPRDAGGGKSGALNLVLQQLTGRWMLVLDADADLQPDVLERVVPLAETGGWAAVQLRKAVVNSRANLLTSAQAMEMAFDAVVQEGRLASGGVAELRGNGQLLRREALLSAGGFNEDTVTDDLDLSFRLLLEGLSIGVLWDPPVQEEAVLTLRALWRQRQRWAEGGLQRFFDYTPGLLSRRLRFSQKLDLAAFFLLQYVLPVVASADLIGSVLTRTAPTMWPFSIVALALSGVAIVTGCRRPAEGPALPAMHPLSVALGILYLVHWFLVIPWVTLKMAVLPKRLVWVKTLHLGADHGDPVVEGVASLGTDPETGDLATEGSQA